MIKKKHLAAVIAVILVLTYVLSMLAIFKVSRDYAEQKFVDYCSNTDTFSYIEDVRDTDPSVEYYGPSMDEFMFDCSLSFQEYPTYISVFDEDGNRVAQSHSVLVIQKDGKQDFLNIEEYLTDDVKNQLSKIDDSFVPVTFEYNVTNDKIIPVEMVYQKINTNKTVSVKFTDYDVTDTVNNFTDDNNDIVDEIFSLLLVNPNQNRFTEKCFEFMKNERDKYDNAKYLYNETADQTVYSADLDYCEELYIVTLEDGKDYMVFAQMKTDFYYDAVHLDSFRQRAITVTVMYAFIGIVTIFVFYNYYKNSSRLEKAKYSFTNAAAHELKTPLAVIENQCECILEKVNEHKNEEYINTIYNESLKMTKLLNDLLQYNKLSLSDDVEKEKVALNGVVVDEIEKYTSFAQLNNITIQSNIDEAVVDCNKGLISMVIDNFISNAIKYSQGDKVTISLTQDKKKYKFSIFNYCNPIEDKNIWDQLIVSSKSRSGDSSGLGLAISKQILELHKYKYGFENKDGGVEFYFIAQ